MREFHFIQKPIPCIVKGHYRLIYVLCRESKESVKMTTTLSDIMKTFPMRILRCCVTRIILN